MTSNIFGTSGIRKVFQNYSESDLVFTPAMALDVGLALGTYLNGTGTVAIGRDIRISALPVEYALISGLISTGCKVKTLGIVTTPTLAMCLKYLEATAGCMITASHNTPEYIGLKVWNTSGMGYTPEQEEKLSELYERKNFIKKEWCEIGKVIPVPDINDIHIVDIQSRIQFDGSQLHVIVDPGNGAGCEIVPKLLGSYNVNVTTLNSQMDGKFPGRLSEPSKENLKQISMFLKASDQEDIGIALDGDADRVIFLDEDGEIVDPIRLFTLMAKYYLEKYKGTKISKENMTVVTAVNSSSLVEDVLNPLECEVLRTEVGDIKVAIALKKCNGFVGGENSGTYIWPRTHYGPDSIVTIAKVLQMIVETGKTLKELLREIPDYPFYTTNNRLKRDFPFTDNIIEKIIREIEDASEKMNVIIKGINKMDGVRFDYNEGWILIRRSGTSPYLRVSGESNTNLERSIEMNNIAVERMKKLDLI